MLRRCDLESRKVKAVIICDGLIREVMSLDSSYESSLSNIGRSEIARLLGSGRQQGRGPLPQFLQLASDVSASTGRGPKLIFLNDILVSRESDNKEHIDVKSCKSTELIEPFDDLGAHATILQTERNIVPWRLILQEISDPNRSDEDEYQFLLVGCQTDGRILATAIFLRNILGYSQVAVCPHLVGSKTQEAHLAALRHNFPTVGVRVLLDLAEAAKFVGLNPKELDDLNLGACRIEPPEIRAELGQDERRIVQRICMNWTQVKLRPLQGGFSGSLLFLASGWKGAARTEPMVIKIDNFEQMQRELDGYYRIRDFIGKHVPTFGYPIVVGKATGVGMELAATEGLPDTLQDHFDSGADGRSASRFMAHLDKAIRLLSDKLYRNTRTVSTFAPYREFGLHTRDQLNWLAENSARIAQDVAAEPIEGLRLDTAGVSKILELIARNEDGMEAEVCLAHGDLNYKNIICDLDNNIWFIDWTHCGEHPVELDFAKLENDLKFVLSNSFGQQDIVQLRKFEAYLIGQRIPEAVDELPKALQFVKADDRYRNILEAITSIRRACFSLKESEDWLLYKIALLKYSLHTLSFDKQRGQGECSLMQLLYVFLSTEILAFELVTDDYHLRIRGDRPSSYPPRQRISIDIAPWSIASSQYSPPYYVDPVVIENDRTQLAGGWSDPEDFSQCGDSVFKGESCLLDDEGRPLNPRGRTGVAGRGMLGRWAANPAVCAIVTRENAAADAIEILVGRREKQLGLSLPRGFLFPGESADQGMSRILLNKTGYQCPVTESENLFDGYYYDPRQTDHAWVELRAYFFGPELANETGLLGPTQAFDEVEWRPLTAATVNDISASGARLVRETISRLKDRGLLSREEATKLLATTG
jgi:ADP-ribose pyrophosphatase